MVYRLMCGLGAAGVDRVLMLPAADGLSTTLHRHLRAGERPAELEELRAARSTARRTTRTPPSSAMRDAGVSRRSSCSAATARTASWPRPAATSRICAISTGTNNAFPDLRETTVAGLAHRLRRDRPAPERPAARVRARGARRRSDRHRARRRRGQPRALHRRPRAVAAGGHQRAVRHLRQPVGGRPVGDRGRAARRSRAAAGRACTSSWARAARSTVALAPGLIAPRVDVATHRVIELGEEVELAPGTIALDGERELERTRRARDRRARPKAR